MKRRCEWASNGDALYQSYHDKEWGVPVHNDRKLFEFLILEGAQAGLSWSTILNKRVNYRKAYDNFDPCKVARYNPAKARKLLKNPGIVRNRLKVRASVESRHPLHADRFRCAVRADGQDCRGYIAQQKHTPLISGIQKKTPFPA